MVVLKLGDVIKLGSSTDNINFLVDYIDYKLLKLVNMKTHEIINYKINYAGEVNGICSNIKIIKHKYE